MPDFLYFKLPSFRCQLYQDYHKDKKVRKCLKSLNSLIFNENFERSHRRGQAHFLSSPEILDISSKREKKAAGKHVYDRPILSWDEEFNYRLFASTVSR